MLLQERRKDHGGDATRRGHYHHLNGFPDFEVAQHPDLDTEVSAEDRFEPPRRQAAGPTPGCRYARDCRTLPQLSDGRRSAELQPARRAGSQRSRPCHVTSTHGGARSEAGNGGDPVTVAEAHRPFHPVPALGEHGDDLAFDIFRVPRRTTTSPALRRGRGEVGMVSVTDAYAEASATTWMTRRPNFRSARCTRSNFSQREIPGGNVQMTRVS